MNTTRDPAFGAERTIGEIFRAFDPFAPTPSRPGPSTDGSSPFGRDGVHRSLRGGDQWKFQFANGYGASVVRHDMSYGADDGLWELAVLGRDGHLTYDTPITDDVIGRLNEGEVASLLDDIEALP